MRGNSVSISAQFHKHVLGLMKVVTRVLPVGLKSVSCTNYHKYFLQFWLNCSGRASRENILLILSLIVERVYKVILQIWLFFLERCSKYKWLCFLIDDWNQTVQLHANCEEALGKIGLMFIVISHVETVTNFIFRILWFHNDPVLQ